MHAVRRLPIATLLLAAAAASLAACGSTSSLTGSDSQQPLDLSAYKTVSVGAFTDDVTETKKPEKQEEKRAEMARVVRDFGEFLQDAIQKVGAFDSVSIGGAARGGIVLSGSITRFEEGSSGARLMLGLGAGSAYFDAKIEVHDGTTGALLASMTTDKNSWVLGGAIAATQTGRGFMEGAAQKCARELYKAKTGKPFQAAK